MITVVQIHTDSTIDAPDSEAWWDVPVAEVAARETTQAARRAYERDKATQRQYLTPPARPDVPREPRRFTSRQRVT